jgi:hypothetical protein
MPRLGFEPTITASERAKTVHALDRSATVTGTYRPISSNDIDINEYLIKSRLKGAAIWPRHSSGG